MQDSSIVGKIQKLLSLSTSSNRNEALAALSKANALMQEYDISHADIRDAELDIAYGEMVDIDRGEVTSHAKYKYFLFAAIGKWCKVRVMGTSLSLQKRSLTWIGRRHRVEIAIHTYEYLVEAIERITPKELRGDRKKQFKVGAATNICERIEAMVAQSESAKIPTPGGAIAIIDPLQEVDLYLAKKFPGTKERQIKGKPGTRDGYEAAKKIGLNPQIDRTFADRLALPSQT